MLHESHYDVIVIGGGIAGSVAAFHLARRRYRVLLLEKETGPHPKVCGEFLRPEARPFLKEMNVEPEMLEATPIGRLRLYSRRFQTESPLPPGTAGVSRERLDETLLSRALDAGAAVVRGFAATRYEEDSGTGDYRVRTTGPSFRSSTLFLATGKSENARLHRRRGRESSAVGFRCPLRLSAAAKKKLDGAVELYLFRGGYAGLSPIENGLANLCFIIDKGIFSKIGGRFLGALNYLQEQNPELNSMLRGAEFESLRPAAVANIPYGHLHEPDASENGTQEKGLYYLGDQFAVIPSLTGAGMVIAFLSGRHAAERYHRGREGPRKETGGYDADLHQAIRPVMNLSYPIHELCRSPFFADALILFLNLFPSSRRYVLEKTALRGDGACFATSARERSV